jgi:hypothetical protein
LNETLKAEITNILNAKKQTIQFINEKFDYKTLNNFENQIRTKYSKKDYRNLKLQIMLMK